MNENINSAHLKEKVKIIKQEIPNIIIPTMGIINEENKVVINNIDYLKENVVKEDKDVE